jgi:hypothetical protein
VFDAPLSADAAWAEAQALVQQYRRRALAIADDRIADLSGDIAGRTRWQMIRSKIAQIMEASADLGRR